MWNYICRWTLPGCYAKKNVTKGMKGAEESVISGLLFSNYAFKRIYHPQLLQRQTPDWIFDSTHKGCSRKKYECIIFWIFYFYFFKYKWGGWFEFDKKKNGASSAVNKGANKLPRCATHRDLNAKWKQCLSSICGWKQAGGCVAFLGCTGCVSVPVTSAEVLPPEISSSAFIDKN